MKSGIFLLLYVGAIVLFLSNKISISGEQTTGNTTAVVLSQENKALWQEMKVTAYDPMDPKSVGKWLDGKTATGKNALVFDGVAADFGLLPPGTKLYIPGIGEKVVDDTGGAMRRAAKRGRYHIDLRMRSRKEALGFGVKQLTVRVTEPGEALNN